MYMTTSEVNSKVAISISGFTHYLPAILI